MSMRNSLRGIFFALILAAAVAAALVPARRESRLYTDLTRAPRMFRIGYASHIALKDFTDFDWDTLHIFPAGTPDDAIIRTLGYYWPGARNNRLLDSSDFNLLVFVNNGKVVRRVYMPRNEADYASIADRSPFAPETALFFLPFEDTPALQILR